MKGTEGLPVGIQVVSYPGKEEEVLQIMKQIEDKVAFRQNNKSSAFHLIE
jgi:Asp-tRNA(Asn)/Glu-tRNA(Gln) amidotransferase A subunit family amidase